MTPSNLQHQSVWSSGVGNWGCFPSFLSVFWVQEDTINKIRISPKCVFMLYCFIWFVIVQHLCIKQWSLLPLYARSLESLYTQVFRNNQISIITCLFARDLPISLKRIAPVTFLMVWGVRGYSNVWKNMVSKITKVIYP